MTIQVTITRDKSDKLLEVTKIHHGASETFVDKEVMQPGETKVYTLHQYNYIQLRELK